MEKNQIVRFLEAIDAALTPHAAPGERLDLQLIGRSALIVRYGLNLATKDVDMVARTDTPELEAKAIALFGKGTSNAVQWDLYLESVPPGLPPVPAGTQMRSVALPGSWQVLQPRIPAPHDLAVTKLKRFHAGDQEDLRIMCDAGELTQEGLEQALAQAYQFGMDEEEQPECKRVNANLRRVIAYLAGRSRTL